MEMNKNILNYKYSLYQECEAKKKGGGESKRQNKNKQNNKNKNLFLGCPETYLEPLRYL